MGWMSNGSLVNGSQLASKYFLPLTSPWAIPSSEEKPKPKLLWGCSQVTQCRWAWRTEQKLNQLIVKTNQALKIISVQCFPEKTLYFIASGINVQTRNAGGGCMEVTRCHDCGRETCRPEHFTSSFQSVFILTPSTPFPFPETQSMGVPDHYFFGGVGRASGHAGSYFPNQGLNPRPLQWKPQGSPWVPHHFQDFYSVV